MYTKHTQMLTSFGSTSKQVDRIGETGIDVGLFFDLFSIKIPAVRPPFDVAHVLRMNLSFCFIRFPEIDHLLSILIDLDHQGQF